MHCVETHIRWYCHNRDCNWSMLGTGPDENTPLRCICGQPMQKAEPIPVFSYLDFLRGEPDEQPE